ncbi:integrase, catalytic region, zinc finger, CCHC-type containing protein [Tanacetum coccineum]
MNNGGEKWTRNTVDKQCAKIVKKNLLIENENLIANCLSTQLLYDVEKSRCLDLEADMSKVHDESKHISKLEGEYLNLQLKYQHLQESFDNNKSHTVQEAPDFNSFFKIKNLEHQIQEKDSVIRNLKVETRKVSTNITRILYESIRYAVLTTSGKESTMLNEIKSLKAQLRRKSLVSLVTMSNKVLGASALNTSTEASRSKPRSNTKKNRILPDKTENKKKVEDHPRINKSVWTKVNRVDSSISSKRVVINSNSESVCKTCNKCLNSASHEICVVNILNSMNATPTVKIVLNKGKQIWKPKGKLSDNSLNKTKQVWKATGKLFANVGYQWRSTGKKVALGKLNCGYQWRPTGKKFALGELCPSTKLSVQCSIITANHQDPNKNWGTEIPNSPLVCFQMQVVQVILWYLDSGCSKHMTGNRSKLKNFVEKFIGSVRFGNDHLGAIMGYGDYVIGDSVISRVYYVEGLGHNLFSVGQFYDFDLEVAFRKHTCFVRDINGTDILKGSRSTNLYTISIDEMMKSSPICLLSKASKSKSWLWHRRLNHLNFGTINDLARKDLLLLVTPDPILIISRSQQTPYELEHDKMHDLTFLRVFVAWNGDLQEEVFVSQPEDLRTGKSPYSRYSSEEGTINMGCFWYPKDNAMSLRSYADAESSGLLDSTGEVHRKVLSFLEIDCNLLFNAQKIQKNPIFQISVDILSNTNFFRAFTASANVPAIYLQQFWNTMKYDEKIGVYRCQIDEQWFDLSADLLRKALAIILFIPDQQSYGRIYSRDPDIFLTQSKSQSQSEGPKEESNSSPHSLWTVFQGSSGQVLSLVNWRASNPHDSTTVPLLKPDEDAPSEKVIHESSSTSNSERTESETEAAAPKDPKKAHEALAGPDPEPMKEDQTGSDSGKLHVSLAGPNPEHMDDEFLATAYPKVHENLKSLITVRTCHSLISESQFGSIDCSLHNVSSTKPSSLVTTPPINTEATIITTSLPEITPFIALQLRVARLEQEIFEVKRLIHSILEWDTLPKEIIRKPKRTGEEKQDSTYSIRPSDWIKPGWVSKERRPRICASGSAQPPSKYDDQCSKRNTGSLMHLLPNNFLLLTTSTGWQMKGKRLRSGGHDNAHVPRRNKVDLRLILRVINSAKYIRKTTALRRVPPGQVTFNHNSSSIRSDYLLTGDKRRNIVLSISKLKAGSLPRYNYLREIILRRADYQEYKISEKDFKNLHPNDFEDLFLLNIQEKLNHLPKTDKTSLHTAVNMWIRNLVIRNRIGDLQLGIESYQSKINLERPNWDAADYYFKEDYTIVPKPRAVVYRDRNDQRKLMRLNELHKFSDGTLTRVMEKLDHMVKDFHLYEYNKGMETRKWSEDDKRRSKDFITVIEKRLQIRRIFRSLESFVGGRIRDIDYRLINRTTRTVPKDRPCILLNWSYKVGKVRSKSENKGKVPTEIELVLELTQQGSSHEVSISTEGVEELKGIVKIKGIEHHGTSDAMYLTLPSHSDLSKDFCFQFSRRLNIVTTTKKLSIDFLTPKHPSKTMVFHNEDGNPARANIKQALGYLKDGDGDGNSQRLRYQKLARSNNRPRVMIYDIQQAGKPLAFEGNRNAQNNGNPTRGRAFNINAANALRDPNVMTCTFSLNDHFATVLFDSRADFSFISTNFASLLNVKPSIVNPGYVIEVADGKKVEVDRIIRDCKLELRNSLFIIDLISLGHGSFDVIVGMD